MVKIPKMNGSEESTDFLTGLVGFTPIENNPDLTPLELIRSAIPDQQIDLVSEVWTFFDGNEYAYLLLAFQDVLAFQNSVFFTATLTKGINESWKLNCAEMGIQRPEDMAVSAQLPNDILSKVKTDFIRGLSDVQR